ncbi:hypothetical protein BKA64DRAFT_127984 [Cadophora sp. MPI-SDFR-AT-0126]|nr:hypothetical protein BKA64DRAFT_127984 [Leotiomycetes sp. MPI-SDFR-AT-0126]
MGSSSHKSRASGRSSTKTSGKSKRKHSDAKSYTSSGPSNEPQPDASEEALESGSEEVPQPTFLFQVNQLPIDVDSAHAYRTNDSGSWNPPIYRDGFGPQIAGNLYRWDASGSITLATDCQWYNGTFWSRSRQQVATYCTRTVFWCNPFAQFMVATGDASSRNMADSDEPHNRWWPLTFEYDGDISRVTESAEGQYLSGSGPGWIADLGLSSYVPRESTRPAGGLSGNLATLFGIISMSCSHRHFDSMITHVLRDHRWRGHSHRDGRSDQRGVVVHIYYDPENTGGSNWETIPYIEFEGSPLVR